MKKPERLPEVQRRTMPLPRVSEERDRTAMMPNIDAMVCPTFRLVIHNVMGFEVGDRVGLNDYGGGFVVVEVGDRWMVIER